MNFSIVLACDNDWGIAKEVSSNTPVSPESILPQSTHDDTKINESNNSSPCISSSPSNETLTLEEGACSSGMPSSIPWRIKEDVAYFKTITTQQDQTLIERGLTRNVIIMGRKTADTFKKPLPNRTNVVITSTNDYRSNEGFLSVATLEDALKMCKMFGDTQNVFVIGGAQLALEAINHRHCRKIYLNYIDRSYDCNVWLSSEFVERLDHMFNLTSDTVENVVCETFKKQCQNSEPGSNVDGDTMLPLVGVTQGLCKLQYNVYECYNEEECAYLDLLQKIVSKANLRETRNAATISIFGERLEFDLDNGVPFLTSKNMFIRGVTAELIMFVNGRTNTMELEEQKVMIWHDNTTKDFITKNGKNLEEGDMGPMYGFQWRHFGAPYEGCRANYDGKGKDQFAEVIDLLVKDPTSRRIEMTTYNPAQVDEGVLHPCHGLITQFYLEENRITLQMYQRSVDTVLGLPFNIASYAILLHIVVNLVNNHRERKHAIDYTPGRVIMVLGDTHIYESHIDAAREHLDRRDKIYPFPTFRLNRQLMSLDDLKLLTTADMIVENYVAGARINASMIA